MLSPENFSIGSKHTMRLLESKRFLSQGTTRNVGSLWWREWLQYFVLSPQGTDREMKSFLSGKSFPDLFTPYQGKLLIKLFKPFISQSSLTQGIVSS